MLLIKSLDQWLTYEQRELWKETHERAAITTEIFIKNNKKNSPKFIDKDYMCRDPLPSFIGPTPFMVPSWSPDTEDWTNTGMACTSRLGVCADSAAMSPLRTLHLKFVFKEIWLQSCKREIEDHCKLIRNGHICTQISFWGETAKRLQVPNVSWVPFKKFLVTWNNQNHH